jgi:hypothetical protein
VPFTPGNVAFDPENVVLVPAPEPVPVPVVTLESSGDDVELVLVSGDGRSVGCRTKEDVAPLAPPSVECVLSVPAATAGPAVAVPVIRLDVVRQH